MIYNWEQKPLKSIKLYYKEDYELANIRTKYYEYKFYNWKDNNFKVERLNDFDYINIYQKDNGKICGKDNFGNNLYFPNDTECPINDIIIINSINADNNNSFDGYQKIQLKNNEILYYTNKNTEGKIIIDLRISNDDDEIQFNINESNELCKSLNKSKYFDGECKYNSFLSTIPFYEHIDSLYYIEQFSYEYNNYYDNYYDNFFNNYKSNKKKLSLYSINYLGINSSAIIDKNLISNYKSNLKIYFSLYKCKIIFFILIFISLYTKYYLYI